MRPENIDHVLMVGGTSSIPYIKREIETHFGSRVQLAHEPDAAIARGAAIVAAEEWLPFNSVPLGLQLTDNSFFPLLNYGEVLEPESSKKLLLFCTDPRIGSANFIVCRPAPEQGIEVNPVAPFAKNNS